MRTCKFDDCDSTDLATRSAMCRMHHREYTREHYKNNKQSYIDKARRNNEKTKELIREAKNVPCMDCKNTYPYYVMDFDHRENKEFDVSRGHQVGKQRVLDEIAKCDVVCSNCHRIRTWQRLQAQNIEPVEIR